MKMKFFTFIPLILIQFFFCSQQDKTYTIEIKDGVRHVLNNAPLWGDEPKVALEFVQKIGELDTEDENYMLYRPLDLSKDSNGNIFVMDHGNYRIQKFDSNGKYRATIGRKGQGPGEFTNMKCMTIDNNGYLYVVQFPNAKIQVFSPAGKEIKRIDMPFMPNILRIMNSGDFVMPAEAKRDKTFKMNLEDSRLISLINREGNILKEFGKLKDFGDSFLNSYYNQFFMELDKGDNITVAFKSQNRIEKYSSRLAGELLFKADRPLNYDLSYAKSMSSFTMGVAGTVEKTASKSDVSVGLGIDHKNRIWVSTYKTKKKLGDEKDTVDFELYDSTGILLGKIPSPRTDQVRIFNDRVYFLEDFNEMVIYEYKIVEK